MPGDSRVVAGELHPQLGDVVSELEDAGERLEKLASATSRERWSQRNDPRRWSVAECIAHLNLTSRAFMPLLRKAIDDGHALGPDRTQRRYRRDPLGWALWATMGPPVRFAKIRTSSPFVPSGDLPRDRLLDEFAELQGRLIALTRDTNQLPLDKVFVQSPFDARAKYNLYSCLTILPRHQHRHLWQAEQVWS